MSQSKNRIPKLVVEIADHVINEMSLKDRITMANLDEGQISKTNQLMTLYIEAKLKKHFSKQEMNGIYEIRLDKIDSNEATLIVNEIWKRLRETHRLKVIVSTQIPERELQKRARLLKIKNSVDFLIAPNQNSLVKTYNSASLFSSKNTLLFFL